MLLRTFRNLSDPKQVFFFKQRENQTLVKAIHKFRQLQFAYGTIFKEGLKLKKNNNLSCKQQDELLEVIIFSEKSPRNQHILGKHFMIWPRSPSSLLQYGKLNFRRTGDIGWLRYADKTQNMPHRTLLSTQWRIDIQDVSCPRILNSSRDQETRCKPLHLISRMTSQTRLITTTILKQLTAFSPQLIW